MTERILEGTIINELGLVNSAHLLLFSMNLIDKYRK